jgi:hypothetical protein
MTEMQPFCGLHEVHTTPAKHRQFESYFSIVVRPPRFASLHNRAEDGLLSINPGLNGTSVSIPLLRPLPHLPSKFPWPLAQRLGFGIPNHAARSLAQSNPNQPLWKRLSGRIQRPTLAQALCFGGSTHRSPRFIRGIIGNPGKAAISQLRRVNPI